MRRDFFGKVFCDKHFPRIEHGVCVHNREELFILAAGLRRFCPDCEAFLQRAQEQLGGEVIEFLAREGAPIWDPEGSEAEQASRLEYPN